MRGVLTLACLGYLAWMATASSAAADCAVLHIAGPTDARGVWDAQVEIANRVFAPAGLCFVAEHYDAPALVLRDRRERDAVGARIPLTARGEPAEAYVFAAERLVDVDDPSVDRLGVHWRVRRERRVHFIVVALTAMPSTLAHELGHYFGLAHTDEEGNLMSYRRTPHQLPSLSAAQVARARGRAARLRRQGLRFREPT